MFKGVLWLFCASVWSAYNLSNNIFIIDCTLSEYEVDEDDALEEMDRVTIAKREIEIVKWYCCHSCCVNYKGGWTGLELNHTFFIIYFFPWKSVLSILSTFDTLSMAYLQRVKQSEFGELRKIQLMKRNPIEQKVMGLCRFTACFYPYDTSVLMFSNCITCSNDTSVF